MATATQELHRLTSLTRRGRHPDRSPLLSGFHTNDLSCFPWYFKHYDDSLPMTTLPGELPATTDSTVAVLSGTADVSPREPDLPWLSRLLHLAAGVVRTAARSYGTHLFRATGSAGGRFPLELYVAVPDGGAIAGGVYWYEPLRHALVRIAPAPLGAAPAVVVTGVPWRTGWRYRERGFRHLFWDAGSMLAQLLAAADSAGLRPALYSRFPDVDVATLVGADLVQELPLAVVGIGPGEPALTSTGAAAAAAVDAAPREFPLVTAAYRAARCAELGSPWDAGGPIEPAVDGSAPVDVVALARGSQRRMDPTKGVSGDLLRTSMGAALRGVDVPHWVAVQSVYGLLPGLYRWPDLTTPVRSGNLRDQLYRVCLRQGLGRDAAFVAIAATDVSRLDDREYCEAQLAAGLVSGRLHLLAYALGASATGMTFADTELPALLGEPLDGLLLTCVGVPEYRSTAGGLPGAPAEIRMVNPGRRPAGEQQGDDRADRQDADAGQGGRPVAGVGGQRLSGRDGHDQCGGAQRAADGEPDRPQHLVEARGTGGFAGRHAAHDLQWIGREHAADAESGQRHHDHQFPHGGPGEQEDHHRAEQAGRAPRDHLFGRAVPQQRAHHPVGRETGQRERHQHQPGDQR
ncbi:MAG TPA: hypothetical protein VFW65_25760 [Pseudonocardiaceae bacterium]|nr:hypothetical protein [Pseudonocardiaceae bacterium]